MLTAELATLLVLSIGGISYVSSVFVGEAWQKPFLKNRMGRPLPLTDAGGRGDLLLQRDPLVLFRRVLLRHPERADLGGGGICPLRRFSLRLSADRLPAGLDGHRISRLSDEEASEALEELEREENEAFVEDLAS